MEATETRTPPEKREYVSMDRDEAIRRIRTALRRRSGKDWSVKGGRGTAWGWIRIDAPPRRRTWDWIPTETRDAYGVPVYRAVPASTGGYMGPDDREELTRLLGLPGPIHIQGESIPASNDYYVEYVDRAEGRAPRRHGTPYWD